MSNKIVNTVGSIKCALNVVLSAIMTGNWHSATDKIPATDHWKAPVWATSPDTWPFDQYLPGVVYIHPDEQGPDFEIGERTIQFFIDGMLVVEVTVLSRRLKLNVEGTRCLAQLAVKSLRWATTHPSRSSNLTWDERDYTDQPPVFSTDLVADDWS